MSLQQTPTNSYCKTSHGRAPLNNVNHNRFANSLILIIIFERFYHIFDDELRRIRVVPKRLPVFRIALAFRRQVNSEIVDLEKPGDIAKMYESMKMVWKIVVTKKMSLTIRKCADPRLLNLALNYECHLLPVRDNILPHKGRSAECILSTR